MADSTLDQFTTFWESTASTYKTGLEDMVNEAAKNTYTFPRLQRAHSMEDMVQGGTNIKDRIFFKATDLTQRINPDAELSYVNPQSGVDTTAPWSILVTHTSWNKWEKELNEVQHSTGTHKAHVFKNVRRQKFQELYTALHNRLDDEMWATPDQTAMEVTTGNALKPYSIPVFVTEESDGLPVGWSGNVQNIDTTAADVDGKWDNQREGYTFDENGTGTGDYGGHLFVAMSKVMQKCRFDQLPKNPEYSDRTTTPHFIGCSLEGLAMYEAALRENQDEFRVGAQDPAYPNPMFRGVPLDYISALDTAAVYNNGSNVGETESASGGTHGPRYYFLNGKYLRCVFHSDSYFEMLPVITPSKQPFDRVQVVDITNNLFCRSRQRHGIVYPTADVDFGATFAGA